MGKRLVIIMSLLLVAVAGVTTFVVIARVRAARQLVVSPATTSPALPSENGGTKNPTDSQTPVSTPPNGIVPREQDAPPAPSEKSLQDADGDGLSDGEESALGSSPARKDTDGDGVSDFDEARVYCTSLVKASTDGQTQDKAWIAARTAEATASGQRPLFCVN